MSDLHTPYGDPHALFQALLPQEQQKDAARRNYSSFSSFDPTRPLPNVATPHNFAAEDASLDTPSTDSPSHAGKSLPLPSQMGTGDMSWLGTDTTARPSYPAATHRPASLSQYDHSLGLPPSPGRFIDPAASTDPYEALMERMKMDALKREHSDSTLEQRQRQLQQQQLQQQQQQQQQQNMAAAFKAFLEFMNAPAHGDSAINPSFGNPRSFNAGSGVAEHPRPGVHPSDDRLLRVAKVVEELWSRVTMLERVVMGQHARIAALQESLEQAKAMARQPPDHRPAQGLPSPSIERANVTDDIMPLWVQELVEEDEESGKPIFFDSDSEDEGKGEGEVKGNPAPPKAVAVPPSAEDSAVMERTRSSNREETTTTTTKTDAAETPPPPYGAPVLTSLEAIVGPSKVKTAAATPEHHKGKGAHDNAKLKAAESDGGKKQNKNQSGNSANAPAAATKTSPLNAVTHVNPVARVEPILKGPAAKLNERLLRTSEELYNFYRDLRTVESGAPSQLPMPVWARVMQRCQLERVEPPKNPAFWDNILAEPAERERTLFVLKCLRFLPKLKQLHVSDCGGDFPFHVGANDDVRKLAFRSLETATLLRTSWLPKYVMSTVQALEERCPGQLRSLTLTRSYGPKDVNVHNLNEKCYGILNFV